MTGLKTLQIEGMSAKDLMQSFDKIISERVSEALKNQPINNAPPEFMSRKEVADLFAVTLPTVHNWINAGILIPYKIGAKTRFKRSEVLESPKAAKVALKGI